MSVFFTRRGAVPNIQKLSDYAEGDIVLIPENGVPVEFYVAKHDYESGLNGVGRTLLVRKDCYDQRKWHSASGNTYANSAIDNWLNNDYKRLFDTNVKNAIGTTNFYYNQGKSTNTVTALSRSVFLLSVTEFGGSESYAKKEGSALPIASILKTAYYNGSLVNQWTRTPYGSDSYNTYFLNTSGSFTYATGNGSQHGSRPCFTIPATTRFDSETNVIL